MNSSVLQDFSIFVLGQLQSAVALKNIVIGFSKFIAMVWYSQVAIWLASATPT